MFTAELPETARQGITCAMREDYTDFGRGGRHRQPSARSRCRENRRALGLQPRCEDAIR